MARFVRWVFRFLIGCVIAFLLLLALVSLVTAQWIVGVVSTLLCGGAVLLYRRMKENASASSREFDVADGGALPLRHGLAGVSFTDPEQAQARPPYSVDFPDSEHVDSVGGVDLVGGAIGRYRIVYRNAFDEETERTIAVKLVEMTAAGVYVRAWCEHAQDDRTFRADRVLEAVDLSTGEVIADPEVYFAGMADFEFSMEQLGEHERVMKRIKSGLDVLLWIANADRHLTENEINTVLAYINERQFVGVRKTTSDGVIPELAEKWMQAARPTMAEALGGLSKMGRSGKAYALTKDFAFDLASSGDPAAKKRFKKMFPDG